MENDHLLIYKYQCYDDLSSRVRTITDQLQFFNYYDVDNGLYDIIEDKLILQVMNTFTKYIVDCHTYREVRLLHNVLLDHIIPLDFEMVSCYKKLKQKKQFKTPW